MADTRIKDLGTTATTLDGTEYFAVDNTANGTQKITSANVKAYVLGSGVDIGGTGAGDIVTIDATQTMTNKRLTSPKINEDVAVTATASEINVLDGIPVTLTATELGYVDGVTSAIQTQLNALACEYGEIYITGGATGQTVPKETWTALTFSAAGGANGESSSNITPDKANSKITVSADGTYLLMAKITMTQSVDALTHQFAIYRDGAALSNTISQTYHATKEKPVTVVCMGIYKEGEQPKDYQVRYYHNHSTDNNITISNANFIVQRLA